ncbi:unnamed protein product, partial [Ectocarpus sp. 4 AP-2014]
SFLVRVGAAERKKKNQGFAVRDCQISASAAAVTMRHVERNILQMATAVTAIATLHLLLGTAAVAEGVRVSPRQRASWQRSTSSLSLSAFSGRRKAGDGLEAPAADGAAAGRRGMGMGAFSAKRRVRSDVHNSIPMLRAQREVSQRATLARQQQQQQQGAGPLFGVSPTTTAEAASSSGGAAAPSAVAGSQKKGVAGAQGLAAKGKGVAKKTANALTTAKTRKRKGRGRRGRRLEPVGRADAVELLRQAVVKYRGAQVSAASPTSSSASPASSSLPPPVASPPSPSPSYSSTSSYASSSYASSTGGVVSSGGAYGGSDGTSSYASISDGVVVIGGGVSSSSSSSSSSKNGGETVKSRLSSSAPIPPASGDGADAGDTRSSTSGTNIDSSVRVEGGSVGSGDDSTAVAAAAVAAEEFAELAVRCLGSALPEIALEAHSLYVRAEASGLQPRATALLPEYPLTTDDVDTEDDNDGHWRRRRDAEVSLLVTAARAHIAMGGVLDGLALIDDATAVG